MPDLEARGKDPNNNWRHAIPAGDVTLGRSHDVSMWAVPWDRQVSKLHALLRWRDGRLVVRRNPKARNQIFFQGEPVETCNVPAGERFVIGETVFLVHDTDPTIAGDLPAPVNELTYSQEELRQAPYVDAADRIELLAALPALIRHSPSDEELEKRVVHILLQCIPRAGGAAVVWLDPATGGGTLKLQVRSAAFRDQPVGSFRPSRRLVFDAICRRRQSVMHLWEPGSAEFTVSPGGNWALCAPLPDEPSPGWALYVTGQVQLTGADFLGKRDALKSDLKFAELVADMFGSLRQVRDLQRRHALLARFLSRPVLAAIAQKDIEDVLRPREAEVTVLFCDLRGSCGIAEDAQYALAGVCDRVNEALGIMTSSITDQDGVIGDFQGDAAMGFWGWPLPTGDQVERAARAALAIWRRFRRAAEQKDNPLAGFRCGIGIANGMAIAGRLGTLDQFKVSVFGPVVNLASRLESLTKTLRVPILLDERCAYRLAQADTGHWARCRRLARLRPYGMRNVLTVSELLPPAVEPGVMPESDRRDYEAALEAFLAGRWEDARGLLQRLPNDGPAEFLRTSMAEHPQGPLPTWDGAISLGKK
jgi:adenylate cyclase